MRIPPPNSAAWRSTLPRAAHTVSGARVAIRLADLARDLAAKADWLYGHIRAQEWVTSREGYGWFNGYYDDDGRRVEGDGAGGVRMTLTGQVFTLMSGIATDEQAAEIVRAADRYLFDPRVGGYRLNTDFGGVQLNMGRCFGFAFGHKENGAMFSHMAVMYANALYQRGKAPEGWAALAGIYQHCQDFAVSRMYPGLPEYISERGRGMYPWLTGSASWYLLTLLTEVFGVKGDLGDLILEPKLVAAQFDPQGDATVRTPVRRARPGDRLSQSAQPRLRCVRHKGHCGRGSAGNARGHALRIAREHITALAAGTRHRVVVTLG